ncbi:MAG: hypothetical protein GY798_20115 [Hyphomicrobiales bacterium]|nr:hypothetical protein [Hyphomicrobiales bacterium]
MREPLLAFATLLLAFGMLTVLSGDKVAAQPGGLKVSIYVDRKSNKAFRKADQELPSHTYSATNAEGEVWLRLKSEELLGLWKGNLPIRADGQSLSMSLFEAARQFAPVFLIIDLANEGGRAVQIANVYFELERSSSDLQPYVTMWGPGALDFAAQNFAPGFSLYNYGWGRVEDARLTYAFGDETGPLTGSFTVELGSFDDSIDATALPGLQALGVKTESLQNKSFECGGNDHQACLARWMGSDLLGGLADSSFTRGQYIFTRAWGELTYTWTDIAGGKNLRVSPVSIDLPLIYVGVQSEFGAAGPVERGFPTTRLPLDQSNLRLPINYAERLAPGEAKRIALNLVADRASSHRFRFVVGLVDGSESSSPVINLQYFVPRMQYYGD